MKQLAIIGQTASGKTDLANKLASELGAVILSLDSLCVYKEIDIASAKPGRDDLARIKYFGIDEIFINEDFSVMQFFDIYRRALKAAQESASALIITGGTSFYLKMLLDGISKMPEPKNQDKLEALMQDLSRAYEFLERTDPAFAKKINRNDTYRIQKALYIILSAGVTPTLWFERNPTQKIIGDVDLFCIEISKDELAKNIDARTEQMFASGLINEACFLERKYGMSTRPLRSIGLKECYEYLNAKISLEGCKSLIKTHTLQLAKRQDTFNKAQFKNVKRLPKEKILKELLCRH